MNSKPKTKINISIVNLQRLERLKLTSGESPENIILRLVVKYGGLI